MSVVPLMSALMPVPEPPPVTWMVVLRVLLHVLLGPALAEHDHRVGALDRDGAAATAGVALHERAGDRRGRRIIVMPDPNRSHVLLSCLLKSFSKRDGEAEQELLLVRGLARFLMYARWCRRSD